MYPTVCGVSLSSWASRNQKFGETRLSSAAGADSQTSVCQAFTDGNRLAVVVVEPGCMSERLDGSGGAVIEPKDTRLILLCEAKLESPGLDSLAMLRMEAA